VKVVRLPVFNEDGYMTSETLEIDVDFFLSSTKGLRSNLVTLVDESEKEKEWPDVAKAEVENLERILSGLPTSAADWETQEELSKKLYTELDLPHELLPTRSIPPVWRTLENFPDYEMSQYQDIRAIGMEYNIPREKGGRTPRIILYKDGRPTMMNISFLHKKAFPELHP